MKETRSGIDCICSSVILICILLGLLGCFYSIAGIEMGSAFSQENIAVFIPFAILCSFLFYSAKSARIGVPVMIIFLSILMGIFRKQMLFCIRIMHSAIILLLNQYYGMDLKMSADLDDIHIVMFRKGSLVFVLCFTFLLSIDVAGFLRAEKIFLLSAAILVLGMCVGKMPSAFFIFLLLMGLFGLFSIRSKNQDFQKKWKVRKGFEVKINCEEQQEVKETLLHSGQKAAVFTMICFLFALVFGSIFESKFEESFMVYHTAIQNWANKLEYTLLNYDYHEFLRDWKSFSETKGAQGKLNNAKVHYTEKEVLRITVDKKPAEGMYLRGFVGKDYQGSRWTDIDEISFSDEVKTWQMGSGSDAASEVGNMIYDKLRKKSFLSTKIEIEYVDAPGRYAYLPYFSKLSDSLSVLADGIVNRSGEKKSEMAAVFCTEGFIVYDYYLCAEYGQEINVQEDNLEERYADYVKKQYMNVPDTIPNLEKECREYYAEYYDLENITRFIQNYLKKQADYSLDLNPVPYGEDFTEYFLYTQKKGYCIHFATAAVLMYRLCQVPARFVEGYVVWPEDFKKNEDGTYTASIPDSRAHAWAEIYYEGFGFIPVDVTPGTITGENNGQAAAGNAVDEDNADETVEEKKEGKESAEELTNDDEVLMTEITGEENPEREDDPSDKKQTKGSEKEEGVNEAGNHDKNDIEQKEKETGNNTDKDDNGNKGESGDATGKNHEDSKVHPETFEDSQEFSSTGVSAEDRVSVNLEHENIVWKKVQIILARLRFPCQIFLTALSVIVLVMAWNIFYQRRKYKKQMQNMLYGVKDRKRREIIRISCRIHGFLKVSGYEKVWEKMCEGQISDQDYGDRIGDTFVFLEKEEYHRFCRIVQKALYDSPDAENVISKEEIEECRGFSKMIRDYLLEQMPGYKKILLKGIIS